MKRDEYLSTNFRRYEFECQGGACCCGSAPIDQRLVDLLQAVRDDLERPIKVTCGFRCIKHNAQTKDAVVDSYHTIGHAADITCYGIRIDDLHLVVQRACESMGYGYIILYRDRNFIHVDIRNY